MENKKLITLIIVGVAALFSLVYGITSSPRGKARVSSKPKTVKIAAARARKGTKRRAKRTEYTSWGRNPFTLTDTSVRMATRLILNGIMWEEDSPLAVINDNVMGIGSRISGNTIVEIKEDKVILNDCDSNFELRLPQ